VIELKFSGMCKDCKMAELELEDSSWYENNVIEHKKWDVHCIHEYACAKWSGFVRMVEATKETEE